MEEKNNIKKQLVYYLLFAVCMIALNYAIQKVNQLVIAPFICSNFGSNEFIQIMYCSTKPNMSELIGSIAAVGITYVIKFFLDKYIVFKKSSLKMKETSQEFLKYLGFAVLTTLENVGIQFILSNLFNLPLELSSTIALSLGYLTKFFLDRKYVFTKDY